MKFTLTTSGTFFNDLNEIRYLKSLGFKFSKFNDKCFFIITEEDEVYPEVEIKSLTGLMEFIHELNHPIIINKNSIEILNGIKECN